MTIEHDAVTAAAELSQVTRDTTKERWLKGAILLVVIAVVVVIGLTSTLLKPATTPKTSQAHTPEETSHTLQDNLAHLRALVDAEKAKLALTQQANVISHTQGLSKDVLTRMNAPTTFFSQAMPGTASVHTTSADQSANNGLIGGDLNSSFVNAGASIGMVEASRLPHPDYTVAAGEVIPAVLESAISSDLPGMVRAVISKDVYALQRERRLIPKGSTLIGQYSSGIVLGQSRILVVWERIQLPNGIVIAVNSPSTDALGRAGSAADFIDNHFMEKFSTSALLSVMGAYTANAGVSNQTQYNSQAAYQSSVADSFQTASQQALMQNLAIKPTLNLNQGALIHVFVARDLSFYQVMLRGAHG